MNQIIAHVLAACSSLSRVGARGVAVAAALTVAVIYGGGTALADPPVISPPIAIGDYVTAFVAAMLVPIGAVLVYKFGIRLFNVALKFFSGGRSVRA